MTTLVTGASGFVGSAVVRRLLAAGHRVRVLLRPASNRRNLENLAVEVAVGDVRDPLSLRRAMAGCRFVFHVAADYRLWSRDPAALYETNVTGTRNVMQTAADAGVERIVYTSSVATLGLKADRTPADEDTSVQLSDMIGHYKRSKFLAEAEVMRLVSEEDLPAVIVNPSTPVGPRDIKPTPTGRMVLDAACGRMPAYVDTGLNLVHVDDVATGHLLALERGVAGQRYILGGENMALQQILGRISEIVGGAPPRLRLPPGLVMPVAYACEAWARLTNGGEPRITVDGVRMSRKYMFYSADKARRDLGFAARPAAEALSDAIDWFRRNGYCR